MSVANEAWKAGDSESRRAKRRAIMRSLITIVGGLATASGFLYTAKNIRAIDRATSLQPTEIGAPFLDRAYAHPGAGPRVFVRVEQGVGDSNACRDLKSNYGRLSVVAFEDPSGTAPRPRCSNGKAGQEASEELATVAAKMRAARVSVLVVDDSGRYVYSGRDAGIDIAVLEGFGRRIVLP
jgi:hypothetical protein